MATWTTRAIAVGALLVVVVSAVAAGGLLSLAAPFSGDAYVSVDDRGPTTVETPYGAATVTYADYGVPHIDADSTAALYFAIGYVQARDRLFQMDLFRRQMAGELSAVFGNRTVESDRFHRQMDFEAAAETKWERLQDTSVGGPLEAYTAGVNEYIESGPLPLEFQLNDYEPDAWTPSDTVLVGMQATWGLSGDFTDLRQATIDERLPAASSLYPDQLDHNLSIFELAGPGEQGGALADRAAGGTDFAGLYDAVEGFDRPPSVGSNNWIVSGNRTADGEPILANDPHLQLLAPPVWYEMQLSSPELSVHGVAFPGAPMVLIGQTDGVAWGITNVGADVTDVYRYEWRGQQYYHDGTWQNASVETERIPVSGGPDRTVELRKTVHGPVLEREGETVAVSWLGLTDTREPLAFFEFNRAETMAEFQAALRNFDMPSSNIVAMADSGDTYYRPSGTYPIRRTDGEVVRGDQVFNGSADEGEWAGFVPYGESDLTGEGFVDYEDVPALEDPKMMGTANQRVIDDPGFYMGTSNHFASPYRGARVDELLERYSGNDGQLTGQEMRAMQRDVTSLAARQFTPYIGDAAAQLTGEAKRVAQDVADWNHEMRADSTEALVYDRWLKQYRDMTFGDEFEANGLDEDYYPKDWTLGQLPEDSSWFDDRRTSVEESRTDIAAKAMIAAVSEIEREGWETYGDVNQLDVAHPFGDAAAFLSYPTRAVNGGPYTLFNVRVDRAPQAGSSWRMIAQPDRTARGVIPGGNDGSYWSEQYSDQLTMWATGQYRPLWTEPGDDPDITFEEGDE